MELIVGGILLFIFLGILGMAFSIAFFILKVAIILAIVMFLLSSKLGIAILVFLLLVMLIA